MKVTVILSVALSLILSLCLNTAAGRLTRNLHQPIMFVCSFLFCCLLTELEIFVGTLPQELSSLQLTGEPVIVKRKKKPSGAQWKRLMKKKEAPYNN